MFVSAAEKYNSVSHCQDEENGEQENEVDDEDDVGEEDEEDGEGT